MHFLSEHHIFIFLMQVLILLVLARGLGELFRLIHQPPLTAELLVGILLGPAVLGFFFPHLHDSIFPPDIVQQDMLETVAWLGVLFLLLQTGLEIDFTSAWAYRVDAVKLGVLGSVVPMVLGFAVAMFIPSNYLVNPDQRLVFALFIAVVLAISAVPVAARALSDLHLSKTDLGFLVMSALSVNDLLAWVAFTIVLSLFTGASGATHALIVIILVIVFTIICLTLGRQYSSTVLKRIKLQNLPEPGTSLTFICILGLLCGVITMKIGIHALYGFFLAGIMAGQSSALSQRTRQIISQMVHAIFVPLFFVNIGLKTNFITGFDPLLAALFCIFGIGGRFLGGWIGVSITRISHANRLSVAIAQTPGGAMEIVIAILALQMGLITEPVFVAIVVAAVVSSIIVGPLLSLSLRSRAHISVLEFFTRFGIVSDLKPTDRDAVIERLCTVAAEQENIGDVDQIVHAVLVRENAASTGMEEGVAVPHARLPLLKRPIVVFGRSLAGVDWNSPDGKPARFIFLILTSEHDLEDQVQILGSIAKAMSDEKLRIQVLNAPDSNAIWHILRSALAPAQIKRRRRGN